MKWKLGQKTVLALAVSSLISTAYADGILESSAAELWAGPYVGAYFGGGNGNFNTTYKSNQFISNTFGSIPIQSSSASTLSSGVLHGQAKGSFADFIVGYNLHPRERIVTGAQLEGNIFNDIAAKSSGNLNNSIQFRNVSGTSQANFATTTTSTFSIRRNLTSILSVICRGGVLIIPNALVYGLVGPTEGNFSIPDAPSYELETTSKNIWKLGISAGAGLEYKWSDHWSFLAEYRYLGFNNINSIGSRSSPTASLSGSAAGSTSVVRGTNTATNSSQSSLNMNIGKIGVVYRI